MSENRKQPNYYEVLGVSEDASEEEIKTARKALVRDLHPDNKQQAYRELFGQLMAEVNHATDVLTDPKQRRQHDDYLERVRNGGESTEDAWTEWEAAEEEDAEDAWARWEAEEEERRRQQEEEQQRRQREQADAERAREAERERQRQQEEQNKRRKRRSALVIVLLPLILGIASVGVYFKITTPAPNFLGLSLAEAAEKAHRTDFEIGVSSATDSSRPRGTIVGQSPLPNERQPPVPIERITDRKVGLTISGGQGTVTVPDVGGVSRLDACKEFMHRGLNAQQCGTWNVIRRGTLAFTANGPRWTVDGTDPPAGTQVRVGTRVSMEYRFQEAFEDDFSSTDGVWPVTKHDKSGNYYAQGRYDIYTPRDGYRWVYIGDPGDIDDVMVGVDVVPGSISSDGSSRWGVICRKLGSDDFYTMTVSSDGVARISKHMDDELSTLESGDASKALREGAVNHIRGACVKNTLRLYVNGQKVVETKAEEFGSGQVGLFAEDVEDGEVLFDNFQVSTPDGTLPSDANAEKASTPDRKHQPDATASISGEDPVSVTASATAPPARDASGKTIQYEPEDAVDGHTDTAWNVDGTGVGQSITLHYDGPFTVDRIGIVPGYDKVDPADGTYRFYQLYVTREAEIRFSDGSTVLATFERDPAMQYTDVPETKTDSITITILDSYPPGDSPTGETYPYTLDKAAISEIEVDGP